MSKQEAFNDGMAYDPEHTAAAYDPDAIERDFLDAIQEGLMEFDIGYDRAGQIAMIISLKCAAIAKGDRWKAQAFALNRALKCLENTAAGAALKIAVWGSGYMSEREAAKRHGVSNVAINKQVNRNRSKLGLTPSPLVDERSKFECEAVRPDEPETGSDEE